MILILKYFCFRQFIFQQNASSSRELPKLGISLDDSQFSWTSSLATPPTYTAEGYFHFFFSFSTAHDNIVSHLKGKLLPLLVPTKTYILQGPNCHVTVLSEKS